MSSSKESVDLSGNWEGHFEYTKGYKEINGQKTQFKMELKVEDDQLSGRAKDLEGIGSHPEEAEIIGSVKERKLDFTKQYPSWLWVDKKGETKIDASHKGPLIHYTGTVSDNGKLMHGIWSIKVKYYFLGIIPYTVKGSGTWRVDKKTKNPVTKY